MGRRSNLIPITRIYDIYPKYTYSNDVKKFMDEIVDIDRANVFTKADMVDVLDKIRVGIEEKYGDYDICEWFEDYDYEENDVSEYRLVGNVSDILEIIDKYKAESEG